MFTVLIQRNCSPAAAQTVKLSSMPPVLGQQRTYFRTGHPSFSLLSMFPLKLYSVFLTNELPPLECPRLRSCKCGHEHCGASRFLEQTGTLRLFGSGSRQNAATALCLQRCHSALVLYLVSVASLPHHLRATHLVFEPTPAKARAFPPGYSASGELEGAGGSGWGLGGRGGGEAGAEVGHGRNTSRHLSLHTMLSSGVIHPFPFLREGFCQGSASHAILAPRCTTR